MGLGAIIIVTGLAYGGFKIQRWFHWTFSYEDDVKTTVCEMVKPEYLKNPEVCK